MHVKGFRSLFALLAVAATLAFVVAESDAAPRMNSGSRGSRTQSAPPPTATSPNAARPIERTTTTPSAATRPAAAPAAAQPGGFFNRPGLLGGLAAGFLGAGLFGLLMGNGFMGGLGGLASMFGLLLQVGIVVGVGYLLYRLWQRRSQPAAALAGGPAARSAYEAPRTNFGGGGGGFGLPGAAPAVVATPLEIQGADFDVFEKLLGQVYAAYSKEDVGAMRAAMTPEMVSYYSEELAKNASRGIINQVADVKLLQGDLSEAWREGDDEYATVAMRYSIVDRTVDRASGRVLEQDPQEGVELWTFRRPRGGNWMLSAIQQTD
jgi:predicted lipid-binding transport protein (Tim44 family)